MAAEGTKSDLPRMTCPHCYLSTRADMPKCLYCGTRLHDNPAQDKARRLKAHESTTPHAHAPRTARTTLSRWR